MKILNAPFRQSSHPVFTVAIAAAALLMCEPGCKSPVTPSGVSASEAPQPRPAPSPAASSADPPASSGSGTFTAYGPLVAEQQADLAAQRDGLVTTVAVGIGDRVRAGQVLAQLDESLLSTQFEAQKARVAATQAEVRDWQAEKLSGEADLRRADQLLQAKVISQDVWEHTKYKLDETNEEVERSKSEEAVAEADLNTISVQLQQSRIVAPFAGVVGRVSVRASQQVKEGDSLFWVTAEAPLRVLFTAPESAMRELRVGSTLDLSTSDYPGLHQVGHILRLSPVIDPASASIQVVGAVDHPSPLLKPGMSMQVRLTP
ncbi:MAG: efflux RND transporter periplasmic adaptor subunit [Terracidiphilus sp.]